MADPEVTRSDVSLHGSWSPELSDESATALARKIAVALTDAGFGNVNALAVTSMGRNPQGKEVPQKHLEVHFTLT